MPSNKNQKDIRPSVAREQLSWLLLEDCEIPVRSRLFPLQPFGLGTGTVESLTSYTIRLAWHHRVSLTNLFEQVIAPLTDKRFIVNGRARILAPAFYGYHRSINGTAETAADWVSYLQTLTLRTDLSALTLRNFRDVFSARELLRPYKAWCPHCYRDQLEHFGVVYDPLLWMINVVTVCHRHERALVSQCPTCNRTLSYLSRRSRPGHCHGCGSSLVNIRRRRSQPEVVDEASIWDGWVARTMAELLAWSGENQITPAGETIGATALTIQEYCFKGNQTAFARALNKHKTTVWGWCHSGRKILLQDLLNICYCLDLKPSSFLAGELISNAELSKVLLRPSFIRRKKIARRNFDSKKIEKRLRHKLDGPHSQSMQQVAVTLGFNKRFLYKHFRDLCRSIAGKHALQQTAGLSL